MTTRGVHKHGVSMVTRRDDVAAVVLAAQFRSSVDVIAIASQS